MPHQHSGASVIRHVENVDVDVYSCIRNVSVQTGEEFSPEFLRAHQPKLDVQTSEESFREFQQDCSNSPIVNISDNRQHRRVGFQCNQNQQFVYEEASSSGILKRDSEYGTDISKGFPLMEVETNPYTDVNRYQNKDHTIYNTQICYTHNAVPQAYPLYSHVSGVPDFSFPGKLKFLCSFGGKILPRPSDGKLRYVGGETRIISILKSLNYQELLEKTCSIWNQPHMIKYQLPDEDLDALISVCSDEDFRHMIEEYHELEKDSKRLRMFLVSLNEPGSPCSYDSRSVDQSDNGSYEYVVAVNGMSGSGSILRKCSSKDNLDGFTVDFSPTMSASSHPINYNSSNKFIQTPSIQSAPSNTYHVNSTPESNSQQLDRYLVESIMTCEDHSRDSIVSSLIHDPHVQWWCEEAENNNNNNKHVSMVSSSVIDNNNTPEKIPSFVYRKDMVKERSQASGNEVVWEEDMIQWTETSNMNFAAFESKGSVENAMLPARTASADMASSATKSSEIDCILNGSSNMLEIPVSAILSHVTSDMSLGESTGGKSLSHDKNDVPVIVEHDLPPGVLSLTKIMPYIQESADNKDDKRVKDEGITHTAIAEVEAGIYGLQIIRNADLEELRELGSGTFGTVYHGKWRGTDVAIKRIRKSCFAGNSSEQDRLKKDFWREAQLLSNLHHPNVVALYGVVPDGPGGTLSTVTEYMASGSLRHVLLEKTRAFDWRKKLMITQDAAIGMEYLHLKKIVHFDLKCENLLVNFGDPQRPICKVGDFGLSRIKHNTFVSGGVRGTLPWMAPELLNGSSTRVCEKVDVFSFGIAMWEILTEDEPYADMHCGAIIGGIVSNTLRPPIPDHCDGRWKALMEECWSYDPVDRPSFTEITNKLQAIIMALQSKRHNNSKDEILKPL
ncbi:hypothetical protein LXL04_003991 [Taraxacum kok-saghyz]